MVERKIQMRKFFSIVRLIIFLFLYSDPTYRGLPNGDCGHPFVAIIYFVSFIIVNYMIVINMYIAIILENFNQAHQEEEIGIVEEDLEMFYTKWAK